MQFVLDCVTTLLIAVLCFLMLFQKYEIKREKLIFRTATLTGLIGIKISSILLQVAPLNLFMSWLMCFSVIFLMYQCNWRTALIYSIVYDMIVLVTDAFGVLFVSAFYGNTITETLGATDLVWHHHIWNWIMQIFLSRITALVIRKKDNTNVKWYEFIFYILYISIFISDSFFRQCIIRNSELYERKVFNIFNARIYDFGCMRYGNS